MAKKMTEELIANEIMVASFMGKHYTSELDLHYRSQFQYLIPVVRKILTMDLPSEIKQLDMKIQDRVWFLRHKVEKALVTCLPRVIFDEVVAFIQFYNVNVKP